MNSTVIKLIISVGALGLILIRWIWPALQIDAITIGILVVAILPWLSSVIESAKFPGGWEIKFRDLETAAKKITGNAPVATTAELPAPSYLQVAGQDANLALVGLRIEIERRLLSLAEKHNIPNPRSMKRLINEIQLRAGVTDASMSGLAEIVEAGNKAAHGARVEDRVADWALDYGPRILAALDEKLKD
ncbi:MAG: hypothetical protein IH977_16075 [Nitrospinae bacterium]|nr:hypothetical protein [Nitrospinota bacterium]